MSETPQVPYRESKLYRIRHSASHVLAQAVLEMFPTGKIAIGPPIADGFYYDFDLPRTLTPEDLEAIEKRMKEIIKGRHPFVRREVGAAEARALFQDQPYKLELIAGLEAGAEDEDGNPIKERPPISLYTSDKFTDLCGGPHVDSTQQIHPDAVKLTTVAGAYWRGDVKRPLLQRIYGTAFESPAALKEHLHRIEEAKKRDHRRLGTDLDLFVTSDDVGPGLILWTPRGAMVRHVAERFSQEAHLKNGYKWVYTPHIGRAQLWKTSGHLEFYKDSMYAPMTIDEEEYFVKPMNCPFHIQIYKSRKKSYRELPLRLAEFGTVYRYELSGVLHGLTRVRGFTQDDAHIFCRPEQVETEIRRAVNFSLYVLRTFGLSDFTAYISTRPAKAVGRDEDWKKAEAALRAAVEAEGLRYKVDEGGGAFYGPKIDLKLLDAIGREWQLSTVQFDFNLPERFNLEFIGEDGKTHRPFMVHRALFGSYERFFGMLIENYAGAFPLWVAPLQVVLVPIADRHVAWAESVAEELTTAGMRVEVNASSERMNAKIRDAQLLKVPFILVMGDREVEAKKVAVRSREGADQGAMTVAEFLDKTRAEREIGKAVKLG